MKLIIYSAICALVLASTLATGAAAITTNLILNGTFDAGTANWTVSGVDGAGGIRADGNPGNAFVLNAGGGSVDPEISQVVGGLNPGWVYTLTGDFRAYHTTRGPSTNAFSVQIDSTIWDFDQPLPLRTWGTFSLQFTATAASQTIRLIGERYGSDYSTQVDNISLVPAVPEPSSALALAGGFAGLLGMRRRRI